METGRAAGAVSVRFIERFRERRVGRPEAHEVTAPLSSAPRRIAEPAFNMPLDVDEVAKRLLASLSLFSPDQGNGQVDTRLQPVLDRLTAEVQPVLKEVVGVRRDLAALAQRVGEPQAQVLSEQLIAQLTVVVHDAVAGLVVSGSVASAPGLGNVEDVPTFIPSNLVPDTDAVISLQETSSGGGSVDAALAALKARKKK